MAVAASAVPTANNEVEARTDKTLGGASNTCSSTQVVSCCNNSNKQNSAGLISAISGPILGNGCTGIGANALIPLEADGKLSSVTTLSNKPASSVCGNQNSVKCCQGNKNTVSHIGSAE
ncbi:hypothetical protein SLS57_004009 [Botryosphaeria dothidea]